MQNQVNKGSQLEGQSAQICYSDNDYFRGKFETLFSENKGLLDALQRTQQHYHSDGDLKNIIAVKDCDNKSASDEFHKLKLGFLVTQMEHLHLLKTLEEVKYKGQQSEKRVKDLEVENSELKMKLVEEEEDDEVIVQSWGSRVALLETENQELKTRLVEDEEEDSVVMARLNARIGELVTENQELKAAINQLEVQVVNVGHNPAAGVDTNGYSNARVIDTETAGKVPIKLDLLKQRINQMVIENDELKSTIARLRWTSHDQMIVDEDSDPLIDEEIIEEEEESSPEYESQESSAEEMEQLERQLNELRDMLSTEQMESKKWRQMYESLKTTKSDDNIDKTPNKDNQRSKPSKNKPKEAADNDNILFDWVLNSTSLFKDAVRKGSAVFSDRFQELYNKVMAENESIIPLEVFNGLNLTQTVITDLNRRLTNKWHELQDLRTVFTAGNEKISAKMSRLYAQTVRKLHDAKHKLLSKEESVRSKVDQFSARMSRLVDKMDAKWNQLLAKLSKRYGQQPSAEKSGRQSADEEYEPKINWFFERANSRRQQPYTTTGFAGHQRSTDRLDRTIRVNVNSRHRVLKGDLYSDVDSGDDEVDNDYDGSDGDSSGAEEAEDVNWFLKERRKPRMESDYSFPRPVSASNARYHRRMKFRSNGRFESSTSHRIHHHYRQR
ncbi:unnamed protein product [Medioppia subpectinata]|uniref:Uncharacterized protein n=1 Tax=Medioppia subpectinata TaxID=1979941 RepID=A0A7R9L0Y2_9ACAR|nr:unnamed protein product [Medioppia subpectinata]CAG2113270.1 unnamed protein product [Medioppia subpectinata]